MKYFYLSFLLGSLFFLFSCGNTNHINASSSKQSSLNMKYNNEEAITFIQNFYKNIYCTQDLPDILLIPEYVAPSLIKKIEKLDLGYDPFIKGQDYDCEALMSHLVIKPSDDNNSKRFRVDINTFPDERVKHVVLVISTDQNQLKINDIEGL